VCPVLAKHWLSDSEWHFKALPARFGGLQGFASTLTQNIADLEMLNEAPQAALEIEFCVCDWNHAFQNKIRTPSRTP
jgi:hypothetical protein